VITVAGFVLWTAYGTLINRWPVVAANAICLAMPGAVLILKWRLDVASTEDCHG
jgi:MtN3 and saliva related transmembrane protein